jgi:signal transduction histidine kinase
MSAPLDVLVVDDEPKISQLLSELLAGRGCAVRVSNDGLDALAQYRRQPSDIVITDIKMPKLGGLELVRELKRIDPLLSIVVITAYPSVEGAVEAMKCGACDFITKPFDIVQIQAILYRCQQRISLSRQLRTAGEGMLKLEELNKRLAELNDLKSQFLAALSHEVNTPLCLMSEWLYLLQDGTLGQMTDDQEHAVEVLIGAYERLHRLLQQLIDLMHGAEIVLRRQAVTAQELVGEAVATVQSKAALRSIHIAVRAPKEPIPLEVDRGRCQLALEHLVDNAVKFNKDSGRVEVHVESLPQQVRVTVRDTGIGIPPEEQQKVFMPFYQVDRRLSRGFDGAGIGLALARRYVELHGGGLRLESEPGKGTTVILELPRHTTSATRPRLESPLL